MPNRVLETTLTGRNLLSPMLASASRDVVAFNSTVATAQGKAATSAVTAAGVQDGAAAKIAASNVKASTSAVVSANAQARAHTQAAQSATLNARVQETANRSLAASNGLLGTSLTPLTAGLGAVGLGLAYAGYRGMEFDSAMSQVQAASQASAADMGKLRDAAVDAGAKTQYSAVEAAQGITEMSKAGVSARDILGGGLTGALNLAAAGQISVAEAAETGATALSVFRLEGNQMSHVADLLAAGAGKAQGSVGDLSAALNQSALVANQTGLSIEDTAGALAMFASNGLIGSDAGTSFKAMLQALTPNSLAASKAMDAIGFSAYDAQGKFVGMESVAGQLRTGLAGLTEEQRNTTLETIFGSDAVRAASVLYKEGATGVDRWRDSVDDAGYAQRQAAQLTDNLRGDLERLGGAADSVFTSLGSAAQGPLRLLTQGLTGIINVGGDVVGFMADNKEIALALAGVLAVQLTGGITAVNAALARFIVTPALLGLGGLLNASVLLGPALSSAAQAVGAFAAAAAPLVAVGAIVYAVTKTVEFATAAGDAREEIRGMWDAVDDSRGTEQIDALDGVLTGLRTKIQGLQQSIGDTRTGLMGGLFMLENGSDVRKLNEYEDALEAAEKKQEEVRESAAVLGERFHLTGDEVLELAGKYGIDLTGSLSETRRLFENFYTADYGTAPTDAANATGAAMVSAKQLTEEAAKAQEDFMADVAAGMAEFVEPLGAYTGLLEEKKEADRKAAEAQAADTDSMTDSWEDYVTDVGVTFDEYKTRLEEQVTAQANWQTNMLLLAGRVSQGTLDELARMGPEGAPLVADLVNRSDAELDHMDDLFAQRSTEATDAWATKLAEATPVLAAIGKTAGQGVVAELVAQLQAGTTTVAAIAQRYGIVMVDGINPVLTALGKPLIVNSPRRGNSYAANGAIHEQHSAEIAPGGAWRIWAEPETGGEAYIPLAASKRGRSMDIWRETGKLLGAPEAQYFASGGFVTAADVPRPPSTAPYGPPISTAADATMQKGFDEVTAWLKANAEATQGGTAGGGTLGGGGWQAIFNYVKAIVPQARVNSAYRPGDPGRHGLGLAVDFGYGSGPGGAGSAGLALINRVLHDGIGASLRELIYDGIGDDRPDLYGGKPHTYAKATQKEHQNHVHAARAAGGPFWPGQNFLVGENGPEIARFNGGTGHVYPTGTSPAAMPGYGAAVGGGAGPLTVSVAAAPVRIYLDGREWRGMARVEAESVLEHREDARGINGRSWK